MKNIHKLFMLYFIIKIIICKTYKPNWNLKRTNPRPCTPRTTINWRRTEWSPYQTPKTPDWTKIFRTQAFEKQFIPEHIQRRRLAFLLARGIITTLGKGEIKTETSTKAPLAYFPETTLHPALFVFYNMLRYDNVKRAYMTPYAELVLDLMNKRHKLDKVLRGPNTQWLIDRGWTSTIKQNKTRKQKTKDNANEGKQKESIRKMIKNMKEEYDKQKEADKGRTIFPKQY